MNVNSIRKEYGGRRSHEGKDFHRFFLLATENRY